MIRNFHRLIVACLWAGVKLGTCLPLFQRKPCLVHISARFIFLPSNGRAFIFRWEFVAGRAYPPAMRTAIYPGSFDPLTNGHLDLVHRAAKLFDRVIVAVAQNESKKGLFSLKERLALVQTAIADMPKVEADSFNGLLVNYVEKRKGQAIIRGLRAVSDFEFEFQLALMNRKLNERVETIFMMPKETYTFLSSRIVKEIARLGGNVDCFVPDHVNAALARKLRK
jgi:pantetheine-phosphate adenylyltransferase